MNILQRNHHFKVTNQDTKCVNVNNNTSASLLKAFALEGTLKPSIQLHHNTCDCIIYNGIELKDLNHL